MQEFLDGVKWSFDNDEACSRVSDNQKVDLYKIVKLLNNFVIGIEFDINASKNLKKEATAVLNQCIKITHDGCIP